MLGDVEHLRPGHPGLYLRTIGGGQAVPEHAQLRGFEHDLHVRNRLVHRAFPERRFDTDVRCEPAQEALRAQPDRDDGSLEIEQPFAASLDTATGERTNERTYERRE